jgi:hypothetical protein
MFTVTNLFGILRSLWLLLTRRRAKAASPSKAAAAMATTSKTEGIQAMTAGFNMQAEIAKLAARIVEPVAAKLSAQELERVVSQIGSAFEHFDKTRTPSDTDFESIAVNILEPLRSELSESEFTRIVDRLRGAMVGFCQSDWGQSAAGTLVQAVPAAPAGSQ